MPSQRREIKSRKESMDIFEKYKNKIETSFSRDEALLVLARAKHCIQLSNEDIEKLGWIAAEVK
jgi:hypothetical protein